MRDMMTFFNKLSQRCFDDCVSTFQSKSLTSKEEGCVHRCASKYFGANARMAMRFGEHSMQKVEQMRDEMRRAGR